MKALTWTNPDGAVNWLVDTLDESRVVAAYRSHKRVFPATNPELVDVHVVRLDRLAVGAAHEKAAGDHIDAAKAAIRGGHWHPASITAAKHHLDMAEHHDFEAAASARKTGDLAHTSKAREIKTLHARVSRKEK